MSEFNETENKIIEYIKKYLPFREEHILSTRELAVKIAKKYNGGGHKAVGTCQFSDENMDTDLPKMLEELCAMSNK